jgi:glucose/arabinose dehydrogenase
LIDGLKDGSMGLLAEGDALYVVAAGGLKRYRGYNGTDKLRGPPELLVALKTGGEHDAHAVRRGPDGLAVPPVRQHRRRAEALARRAVAGERADRRALVRLSPDFKTVEVVADGFRNPYGFDFNPDGEAFTYDSDNERCVGLPWYEGCDSCTSCPAGTTGGGRRSAGRRGASRRTSPTW